MLLRILRSAFTPRRDPAALAQAAVAHHARGELPQAERLFREVVSHQPADANAWKNLAATLIAQAKYAEAVPVLEELLALEPRFAEAHFELGTCHNRLRDNTRAISHFQQALKLKPALAVAHAGLINAYLDACEWDAAERWADELRRWRRGHPGDWADRIEIGRAHV